MDEPSSIRPPHRSPAVQLIYELLLLLSATLISASIFSFLGSSLATRIFGVSREAIMGFDAGAPREVESAFKLVQAFSAVGTFIVPAWALSRFLGQSFSRFTGFTGSVYAPMVGLAVLSLIVAQPFVDFLQQFNAGLSLPGSMEELQKSMEEMEARAMRFTMGFLEMRGLGDLLVNTLIIAIIPAVGEEIFFRGLLQRRIQAWSGHPHLAIWMAAIVFSAVHLQFFGFLPRMFLGAVFGYLFYYGGSLWYPVAAHFVNNFGALAVVYFSEERHPEAINQSMDIPHIGNIISLLVLIAIVFGFRAYSNRRKPQPPVEGLPTGEWQKVFETRDRIKAEILQGKLEARDIRAVIVDKKDSAYQLFGYIELHVPDEYLHEARHIVQQEENAG